MATTYNAHIPEAERKLAILKDIKIRRKLYLIFKGKRDKKCGAITIDENKRCESQFCHRQLNKLDGDICVLIKKLHSDTFEGMRRLSEIEQELSLIKGNKEKMGKKIEKTQAEAEAKEYVGDQEVSKEIIEKRKQTRKRKASASLQANLSSLSAKEHDLLIEQAEINQIHEQRLRIAQDSKNQLAYVFLMEIHRYLDSAKKTGMQAPDIEHILSARIVEL